jgi:hypothetical protein
VLMLLANIPHGIAEELLVLAHGFDRATIGGLVHQGLATAEREVVTGPGRAVALAFLCEIAVAIAPRAATGLYFRGASASAERPGTSLNVLALCCRKSGTDEAH